MPLRDLSLRVLWHRRSRGVMAGGKNPLVTPETSGTRAAFEDGPSPEDVPGGYGLGSTPAVLGGFCPGKHAPPRKSPAPPEPGSSPPGRSERSRPGDAPAPALGMRFPRVPTPPARAPCPGPETKEWTHGFQFGKRHPSHFVGPSEISHAGKNATRICFRRVGVFHPSLRVRSRAAIPGGLRNSMGFCLLWLLGQFCRRSLVSEMCWRPVLTCSGELSVAREGGKPARPFWMGTSDLKRQRLREHGEHGAQVTPPKPAAPRLRTGLGWGTAPAFSASPGAAFDTHPLKPPRIHRPEPSASLSSPQPSCPRWHRAGDSCSWPNTRHPVCLRANTCIPGTFIELRFTSPKPLSVMYLKDTEHRYYIHRKYCSQ